MRGLDAEPVTQAEAAVLFGRFDPLESVALAVSGGPDSTALLGLWAGCRRGRGDVVVTVDHGLRPEARGEAEAVGRFARRLGLEHVVLTWDGDKPASGVQEAARRARYSLMRAFVQARGLQGVVLAHTRDDQAETVLMRLVRGSGLRGLAGMTEFSNLDGLSLLRPLLAVSKARLVASCEANGWPFIRDPSNENAAFLRPRLRRLMPLLAAEGLTAERLSVLAERAAEADFLLDHVARSALIDSDAALRGRKAGYGAVHAPTMLGKGREKAVRMLSLAIRGYDPEAVPVLLLERLEALAERLLAAFEAGRPHTGTIAGYKVRLEGDIVRISPAPPRRRLS
ncbi:MAG TPA: tRNA lysidine(34) synthetase TilS [Beijerinckiaceae bacterium]|nr:tRNA lysidine(34) synthetase TilS [Beijerinckiaceae bacterium]